ncbi:RNA-binding S4 domain-containing protein [Corynebacterium sp. zg254]|uniref:RNA-binding S4 domain-containing protein n=1 Tax=Corynebacterium zhongnanshanii TaxID=2768834 RepID=A0ABQ6VHN8_9CORY|nr:MULTISPECIES: RNA-binding S4 domain-containing protein [Corynebacterium]KAB3519270.1 RNA-binding S4 domain-containing protein [Corynebacterium zhongnanshanii]MCR5915126.1 RNA-binding S4 domain-containing protein [Corynebacterium sp. zg254]
MHIPEISIRDQEIKLGQFVKLANLVETGGVAKEVIASGAVNVNGQTETRRGKTLRAGDEVTLVDLTTGEVLVGARVAVNENFGVDDDDDLGEYFDEATADDDFDPEKWRNM